MKKYSEFINFPIYLWASKKVDVEVPADEESSKEEEEEKEKDEDEEACKSHPSILCFSNINHISCCANIYNLCFD